MDLSSIRKLSESREGGLKKLASDIGMSEANLHRCINNNKIQASDLERIAIALDVDVRTFFDQAAIKNDSHIHAVANGKRSVAAVNSEIKTADDKYLQERISHLEDVLKEKERLIQVLMKKL